MDLESPVTGPSGVCGEAPDGSSQRLFVHFDNVRLGASLFRYAHSLVPLCFENSTW